MKTTTITVPNNNNNKNNSNYNNNNLIMNLYTGVEKDVKVISYTGRLVHSLLVP